MLGPGDELLLLDGTYTGANSGYLLVDCTQNANDGSPSQPITVRAQHERKAFLSGDGSSGPVVAVDNCSAWEIDGLHAEYGDLPSNNPDLGPVVRVENSNYINLRRLLVAHPDRNAAKYNSCGIVVSDSSNVLVEENEVYDFASDGIDINLSSEVTLRRNYLNSRGTPDLDGGPSTDCPDQGDIALDLDTSGKSIIENNIIEGACEGIEIRSNGNPSLVGHTDDDLLLGNMMVDCDQGVTVGAYCGGTGANACVGQQPRHTQIIDDLALRSSTFGFETDTASDTVFDSDTALQGAGDGFDLMSSDLPGKSTASGLDDLAAGNGGVGFFADQSYSWRLDGLDASQNGNGDYQGPDAGPDAGYLDTHTLLDGFGTCLVYVPPTSLLRDAGVGGAPIGAEVIFRYVDGQLTGEKLWDQSTGAFPCGAVIAGVNDIDGGSCTSANRTLNVGANGCAVP